MAAVVADVPEELQRRMSKENQSTREDHRAQPLPMDVPRHKQ